MLIENRCSIYEHRPRTCRSYDCRIFAAAGLELDEAEKVGIVDRVRQWRFTFASTTDAVRRQSVVEAAAYLDTHRELFPDAAGPATVTALALEAIELHDHFLFRDAETGEIAVVHPDPETIRHDLAARSRQPS
jgi:hypothetical protein